jgi:mRNA interferase MazF
VIHPGDIWWADLNKPSGSEPGYRRPVVVVQSDALNRSHLATVVCVPLTSNLAWAKAPGNVLLPSKLTGLAKDSVVNASQILALDKETLIEFVGNLPSKKVQLILDGIDIVLGR